MEAWTRQLVAAAAFAALLYALSPIVPAPWHAALGLPTVLVLGGPLAVLLFTPHLVADARGWARATALALPGVGLAEAIRETVRSAAYEPYAEVAAIHAVSIATYAIWSVAAAIALAYVGRLAPGARWELAGCAAVAGSIAVFVDVAPLLFGLQIVALVAVSRFHRPTAVWARASVVGASVLASGLALLWVVAGEIWPPRLVLGEAASLALVPLALAAVVTFVAVLLRGPSPAS